MAFIKKQTIRRPHFEVARWLTNEQIKKIEVSLTSILNAHLNSIKHNEWFSLSSLIGGENENWPDPIIFVYNAYIAHDPESAVINAAKDMGWILKRILNSDKKLFDSNKSYRGKKYVNIYKWISNS